MIKYLKNLKSLLPTYRLIQLSKIYMEMQELTSTVYVYTFLLFIYIVIRNKYISIFIRILKKNK